MFALTLLIPTKNEADNIESCINSAKDICNEIIVVDSYSQDNTTELATNLGAKIYLREFDNFSNQKNWAIEKAQNQWILLLDADEQLTADLKQEIIQLITTNAIENHNAYWVYRENWFFDQPIRYGGYQNDKVIRLFKRDSCTYTNHVHEKLQVEGSTGFLKNKLYHNTYKGFDFHIAKLGNYATLQALDYDKKIKNIGFYHLIAKPAFRFFKHYVIKKGYKDGVPGIILACLGAYATFLRFVKLWMLRKGLKH